MSTYAKSNEEETEDKKGSHEGEEDSDDCDETVIKGLSTCDEDKDLDNEGRLIAKVFPHFVMVSVYTPHSGVGDLKRLDYRVERWDRAFEAYINRIKA